MYIYKLELKNFRNYEDLNISFNKNVNLILGKNAQGKTNLLEAIYLSQIGRSFRTNHDHELIKFGEEETKVKVYVHKSYLDTSVEIILRSKGKSAADKYIKKDGKNIKQSSQLLNNIYFVVFSPEDLKLVKEDPEKRRRFIDRELCQISPQYLSVYNDYKKTLIQRNAYLKEEKIDKDIIDIWDTQLARFGALIIILRDNFIKKISSYSAKIHEGITAGSESLKIIYDPNIKLMPTIEEQEDLFYSQLKSSYLSDLKQRTTSVGPHRDDISFFVNDVNMRSFGSQGQQRTCALSIKLAEINLIKEEAGEDAILLLDDVMSELDLSRQEYLIDTIKDNQIFITTTDMDKGILDRFKEASVYQVKKGKIEKK